MGHRSTSRVAAFLAVILVGATPSTISPISPADTSNPISACVSAIQPPEPTSGTPHPRGMVVYNLCDGTINLAGCYIDGSSCWVYGVPPLRTEQLPPMSVINAHHGVHFYPCERGYDAVDPNGQPLTRYAASYHCAAEGAAVVEPPCTVTDAPARTIQVPHVDDPEPQSGFLDVRIIVSLNADGSVSGAAVQHPSEWPADDREALRVAEQSLYAPRVKNCQGVPSDYLFVVEFNG